MTKKVCISGYYGFDNFGDELILKILVDNLKKNKPDIDITVFSSNPEKTAKEHCVNSVQTFNLKQIINSLKKCDCLISGGGSLLQDKTSKKSLLYYLFVLLSAQLLKKKTIIFAQGIGPVDNPILKKLTMFAIKKSALITVRDENSFSLLNKSGIKADLCADPVWNFEVKERERKGRTGIQLRNFPNISENFLSNLAEEINKYYKEKEILILSLQNTIDLDICKKLKDKLLSINPNINVKVIENTSNEKTAEEISSLDELIAMRYHACLIGIRAGVKVLPVSYDIKVENLAKEFNLKYIDIKDSTDYLAKQGDMHKIFDEFVNGEYKINNKNIETKSYDFNKLINNL